VDSQDGVGQGMGSWQGFGSFVATPSSPSRPTASEKESVERLDGNDEMYAMYKRYRRGAVNGSPTAMAHVGMCLLEGTGVEKDSRAGVDWLRRAARRNDVEALNALGVLWAEGAPVECNMSPNDKKAAKYYKRAAELGHVDGATNLAMAHLVGRGVTQDSRAAKHWLHVAASKRHPGASLLLGKLLLDGADGVEADPARGVRYLQVAAEAGNGEALNHLAHCYREGLGVPADLKNAEDYEVSAAKAGNVCVAVDAGLALLDNGEVQRSRAPFAQDAETGNQPCATCSLRLPHPPPVPSVGGNASSETADAVRPSTPPVPVSSVNTAEPSVVLPDFGRQPSLGRHSRNLSQDRRSSAGLETVHEDFNVEPSPLSMDSVLFGGRTAGRRALDYDPARVLRRSCSDRGSQRNISLAGHPEIGQVLRRSTSDLAVPTVKGRPQFVRSSSFTALADEAFAPEMRVTQRWSRSGVAALNASGLSAYHPGPATAPIAGASYCSTTDGRSQEGSVIVHNPAQQAPPVKMSRRPSLLKSVRDSLSGANKAVSTTSTSGGNVSRGWGILKTVVASGGRQTDRRNAEEAIARLGRVSQARMKEELEEMRTLARDSHVLSRTLETVVQKFWLRILALEDQVRDLGHDPVQKPDARLTEIAGVSSEELAAVRGYPEGPLYHAKDLFKFDAVEDLPSPFDD